MKVLVTGHGGYVGGVLTQVLLERGHEVSGIDTGLYAGTELSPMPGLKRELKKDVRDVEAADFTGFDAVVHLAALSNDPLGELNPGLTEDINLGGTLRVADCAKAAGVRRFVYASSQSMYGVSDTDAELDEYESDKKPVTAYARTKWEAEVALRKREAPTFEVTAMRPSTVYGVGPRLRCDIVFNNLLACAFTRGAIEIKSDGTPWRPVIHVRDVSAAFVAGLEAPAALVAGQAFNVGAPGGNFTVRQIAEAAARSMPGSSLVFTGEHGADSRTYRISFARIARVLGGHFQPSWTLDRAGAEMIAFFKEVAFTEADFRGPRCNRLPKIREHLDAGRLRADLRWQ